MKAKMNNWRGWIKETRPDILISKYKRMLEECGFCIRNTITEFFDPQGFTALFLLSESHFAIHTFPEEGKTYIELSSCVDMPFLAFMEKIGGEHHAETNVASTAGE